MDEESGDEAEGVEADTKMTLQGGVSEILLTALKLLSVLLTILSHLLELEVLESLVVFIQCLSVPIGEWCLSYH